MSAEVIEAVKKLNEAWLARRFDELKNFFHPDVVVAHPRFLRRTNGRDALIASYIDFVAQAKIEVFETGEPQVDLTNDVAITVLPWRMKYQFETEQYDESGWDLMVWNRISDAWVVVWRTVMLKS